MNVDVLYEHDLTTAQSAPACPYPVPRYEAIYEKMQVSDAALVKFKNCDVLDRNAVLPAQIQPELIENTTQIANRIALNQ